MPLPTTLRATAVFFLLINVVTWGAALPLVKPALSFTDPFPFLLYRYLFAALFSLPILAYYLHKKPKLSKHIFIIVVLEILGTTLALALLYAGLELTTSLEASLIVTTTPLFTTIAGVWYLKEKQEKHEWLGLGIALLATIALSIEPIVMGKASYGTFSLWGNLLIFLQNICTAAYFVLAKKYYQKIPKLFVTTISFYVGIVSFGLLTLWHTGIDLTELPQFAISQLQHWEVFGAVMYMAIFGSIIGLTAYIQGQNGIEASEASLFTYLQPIVYIPLAILLLKEPASAYLWIAVFFIGLGVVIAEVRVPKKRH